MSASSALLTLSCVLGVAVASAAAAAAPFSPAAGLRPNVLFMVVDGEIFKHGNFPRSNNGSLIFIVAVATSWPGI